MTNLERATPRVVSAVITAIGKGMGDYWMSELTDDSDRTKIGNMLATSNDQFSMYRAVRFGNPLKREVAP